MKAVVYGPMWQAECVCGWMSDICDSEAEAETVSEAHTCNRYATPVAPDGYHWDLVPDEMETE